MGVRMNLRAIVAAKRKSILAMTDDELQALAIREFDIFVKRSGVKDAVELKSLIHAMRATAFRRGLSEADLATIYHADVLMMLRLLSLQ
jgi:hypothetical protein